MSLISCDSENVIIETIKKAEDSNDIIIRVYECFNKRTMAKIRFTKELHEVYECDLMENNLKELKISGNSFDVEIKPFEIKTFKLK